MATKSIFPADSSLQYNNDGTFVLIETWHVNGMTSTTEAAARLEALTAVNVDIQTTKSITYDGLTQAMTMQTATVRILSGHTAAGAQGQAIVTIHWGTNDSPRLDSAGNGGWIFETYSDSSREPRGLNFAYVPITVKYQPAGMDNAEWNNDWNQRRYNRGITVPGFTNRPHVIGRRQISFLAASNMIPHPLSWPSYYVDYVNDAVTAGKDANRLPAILKGVFRCSAIRVYTRNQNVSYIVEAEFVRDPLGHDPMVLFVDSQTGLVPADVVVDAGMKYAWPTVRATAATPYGAARPQMVRGSRNFNDERLRIDLRPFNAT